MIEHGRGQHIYIVTTFDTYIASSTSNILLLSALSRPRDDLHASVPRPDCSSLGAIRPERLELSSPQLLRVPAHQHHSLRHHQNAYSLDHFKQAALRYEHERSREDGLEELR
jgi:hypothetical protein